MSNMLSISALALDIKEGCPQMKNENNVFVPLIFWFDNNNYHFDKKILNFKIVFQVPG